MSIILRTLFIYAVVLIMVRIMGKREIGQLSIFDFVVSIIIAELAAIPMEDLEKPVFQSLIPLFTVGGAEILIAYLAMKSLTFRAIVDGKPSIIIDKGKLRIDNMKTSRYTIDDLLIQLRQCGYNDLREVEFAVLENSGKLSVVPKSQYRPVTPKDLNICTEYEGLALPLIMDGTIIKNNLNEIQKNDTWLKEQLYQQNISSEQDVFFGMVNVDGKLYLYTRQGQEYNLKIH